ncbi:MAG: polysaccharide biosynthesis protein [Nitrosopumilaceae archaeon]
MIKLNPNVKKELKNKTILVTGGGGSIGSHLIKRLLDYPIKTVRALDIDEHALFKLKRSNDDPRLRLLLGSILDKDRITMACNNIDIIIHTAAIKNIEISEFNPIETIDTNVNGTVNLIKIATELKPEKLLNISTDKAVESTTLYGTTKQLSERLVSWAGIHIPDTKFGTIRFGNVFETRGNVFEVWKEEAEKNDSLTITDPSMKRYFFSIEEAVSFILESLTMINRGEIFIPKMREYSLKKLANKISSNHNIIGLRKGEKIAEKLIDKNEIKHAVEKKNMWIIHVND